MDSANTNNELLQLLDDDGFVAVRQFLDATELTELHSNLQRFIKEIVPHLPCEHVFYEVKNNSATLKQIQSNDIYPNLIAKTQRLVEGIQAAANEVGIPLTTNHIGSMWGPFFTQESQISNFNQVMSCDIERFNQFFHGLIAA